ncbi:MAG: helix-turn-helix domain-containing protein [Pseudomonadota bacterium]
MSTYLRSGPALHARSPGSASCPGCVDCAALPTCFSGNLGDLDELWPKDIFSAKRRVCRHECLYNVDERMATLYQVRYGQFKVVGRDPTGEQRVIGFRMAGDLMGMDAIPTGRHQYRAVALEDSEVCGISYAALEAAMQASPALQRHFIRYLMQEAIASTATATQLAAMRCDQRFGYFLLNLSARYAEQGYSGKSFRLSMSRADIGSQLGISAESVSRLIGRFKANGWIAVSHRNVDITDRDRLRLLLRAEPEFGVDTAVQPGVAQMNSTRQRC